MGKVQLYSGEKIGQNPVSEYNECYVNDFFQDLRQHGRSAISYFFTNFVVCHRNFFFIPNTRTEKSINVKILVKSII